MPEIEAIDIGRCLADNLLDNAVNAFVVMDIAAPTTAEQAPARSHKFGYLGLGLPTPTFPEFC
jgi:hypothetical protein